MRLSSVLFRILVVAGTYATRLCGAQAANCADGYYWNGSACLDCGAGYYCNNDNRYSCLDINPHPYLTQANTVVNGVWHSPNAWGAAQCVCYWYIPNPDSTRSMYMYENPCQNGPGGTTYTINSWCNSGYYGINPLGFSSWYTDCAACTNKPANSHYTGRGSDWYYSGGTQNDCPWECDAGYGRTDAGTCQLLCAAGITKLHAGGLTIPLYKAKHTSPAINIQYNGQICYASLAPGAASSALNINYSGNTYHSIR